MSTNREKVSYCIGLKTGDDLINQFKEIDVTSLKKGFEDAIARRTPIYAEEEIRRILEDLSRQIQAQQKAYVLQVAERNRQEGEAFLSENKNQTGIVALASGLQYKILAEGSGEVHPTPYDVVSIHYTVNSITGRTFESTFQKGQPVKLPMNQAIPGWSEALRQMKVGDRWQLFVPSYLAYGENGFGQFIEPNMTLVFEVELLSINA